MRKTRTPAKEEREARSHGAKRRPCEHRSRGIVAGRGDLALPGPRCVCAGRGSVLPWSASTAASERRSRARGVPRSNGSSIGLRRAFRSSASSRCGTASSHGSDSTGASRTRTRRSPPLLRRASCCSASRWGEPSRPRVGGSAIRRRRARDSRLGCPNGSRSPGCAASGSASCTAGSTGRSRGSRASRRRTRAPDSNELSRSVLGVSTR